VSEVNVPWPVVAVVISALITGAAMYAATQRTIGALEATVQAQQSRLDRAEGNMHELERLLLRGQ